MFSALHQHPQARVQGRGQSPGKQPQGHHCCPFPSCWRWPDQKCKSFPHTLAGEGVTQSEAAAGGAAPTCPTEPGPSTVPASTGQREAALPAYSYPVCLHRHPAHLSRGVQTILQQVSLQETATFMAHT